MKGLALIIIVLCLIPSALFAQDFQITDEISWYQVMPIQGDYFDEQEEFTIVFADLQESFYEVEKGTSWILILSFPDDIQNIPESYYITAMAMYNEQGQKISFMEKEFEGKLLTVLPYKKAELKDCQAFIKSNVGSDCYDLDGKSFNCKNLAISSQVQDYSTAVKPKSEWEQKLKLWFELAQKYAMVEKFNFALTYEQYHVLRFEKIYK